MKVTIDFDDLFASYDEVTEETTGVVQQIKDEVERRLIDYVASKIGWQIGYSIDKSFSVDFKDSAMTHDDFKKLAEVIINKYKKKIKEDIKKVLEE